MLKEAQTFRSGSQYAIAVYKATLRGVFDLCCVLRGMDKFLVDLIADVKFAETLLEKALEFNYRKLIRPRHTRLVKMLTRTAPGGGYVRASSNNIGSDVPTDYVMALFMYAVTLGRYPLHLEKSEE